MKLKELIHRKIGKTNYQGIVIRVDDKSEVNWWMTGESEIFSISLDIKISGPFSLNCIDGHLEFFDAWEY